MPVQCSIMYCTKIKKKYKVFFGRYVYEKKTIIEWWSVFYTLQHETKEVEAIRISNAIINNSFN